MFVKKNTKWLSEPIDLSHLKQQKSPSRRSYVRKIRQKKSFSNLGISQRQKIAKRVRESHSEKAILYAARQILKERKGSEAGFIFNQILYVENAAKRLKELDSVTLPTPIPFDTALAIVSKGKMPRKSYLRFRKVTKAHHADIWPPWPGIQKSKKEVLPKGIEIDDYDSIVPMQPLLDKTTSRIFDENEIQMKVVQLVEDNNNGPENPIQLHLLAKYGFDGSSNQSMYNQKPSPTKIIKSRRGRTVQKIKKPEDSNLVASQISVIWLGWGEEILYLNKMMNASAGQRPLRLRFGKETRESSKNEWDRLNAEIQKLIPFSPMQNVQVRYFLVPTQFDTKAICDILEIRSYAKSWPCGKNPKDFPLDPLQVCQFLEGLPLFGISPCHTRMRIFDFLIKTGYDCDFKEPFKSKFHATLRARAKARIQDEIFQHFGVRIDEPRASGGNSTTGNAARRCMADSKKLAEILCLPEKIIILARTLCIAVASNEPVNLDQLHSVGQELKSEFKDFFVQENGQTWRRMPPTLHRTIDHSRDILSRFPCPPGYLSEEGSESNNKVIRHARLFNARKTSRKNNLSDIITLLLVNSDPKILRINETVNSKSKKSLPVLTELQPIFENPNVLSLDQFEEHLQNGIFEEDFEDEILCE